MCGLRRGELVGLRWSDVDLEARSLRVEQSIVPHRGGAVIHPPKRNSRRTVALGEACVAALREHRTRQLAHRLAVGPLWCDYNLVFPSERGTAIHPDNLTHYFREMAEQAGMPALTLHGLRHTAASMAIAAGVDLTVVSDQLGHSTTAITADFYVHVKDRTKRQAADAVDEMVFGTRLAR